MSNQAITWAADIENVSMAEKCLLLILANHANNFHEAYPSWTRILKQTRMSRNTLYKCLVSLQSKGYILKTGDLKRQTFIYRLMIVETYNQPILSTTSTKIDTSEKLSTGTKIDTGTSTKIDTTTSTNFGTWKPKQNPKRNHQAKYVFLDTKTQIKNRLQTLHLTSSEDLVSQILFYIETKAIQEDNLEDNAKFINIACSLVKRNLWKIPNGWNGITSKSIKDEEAEYERKKQIQIIEDGKMARAIASEALSRSQSIAMPELRTKREPGTPISPVASMHLKDILKNLRGAYA